MNRLVPEVCNGSALREAARHATKLYDDRLAPTGLGLNQYTALRKLQYFGAITIQNLAEHLVMDRSTVARLLGPLEQRGLLTVEVSKDDRRSRVVELTKTGRSLLKQALPLWSRAQDDFERSFGKKNASDLRLALKRVARADFTQQGE
jgi:DNA-binding MarR family transcriptional regulator